MKPATHSQSVWGLRGPRLRSPDVVLEEAEQEVELLAERKPRRHATLPALRESFVPISRCYFSLAALTRRVELDAKVREHGLARLYKMRSFLETKLLEELRANGEELSVLQEATKDSFFGKSKKQGVSIRYALASCVPTATCGGRCYAHDGRDRELLHIYRGVLNYYVGLEFENGSPKRRKQILSLLSRSIDKGVDAALTDQTSALTEGYSRLPRIRFSHVGEMAATPEFTNALALEVRKRDPIVQCVIYTRHPQAKLLDTNLLVVNFTLEGVGDVRMKLVPSGARIVNSAWDGKINKVAEVNFLEHHVEKSTIAKGAGSICPVTAHHKLTPSCDLARCQKCFVPVRTTLNGHGPSNDR